jgi:phosphoribosylamine-glycine ligase
MGLEDANLKHIFLTDVYLDNFGNYRWAGADGVLLKATARGRNIPEARRRAYRTIRNLSVLDAQYRQDIGAQSDRQIRELRGMGFLA